MKKDHRMPRGDQHESAPKSADFFDSYRAAPDEKKAADREKNLS